MMSARTSTLVLGGTIMFLLAIFVAVTLSAFGVVAYMVFQLLENMF